MNVVVDASAFTSLFLPDEDSSTVERYLANADILAAPKLVIIETAAAIFRRVRKGSLTILQAEGASDAWIREAQSGGIAFYEDLDVVSDACVAARILNHALQDCIYLELARKLNYTLLTGDRVFARKAVALYPDIQAY